MIRVVLPSPLQVLARAQREVTLEVPTPATPEAVLDALEQRYPMLAGTIRDPISRRRRPYLRFFCCSEDLSHEPLDAPLPDKVTSGEEPFYIVGAIAGG